MAQVETGLNGPRLNAYGPGQHLPPVSAMNPAMRRSNSSELVASEDPFWDPSDILPPADYNFKDEGDGKGRTGI